MRNRFRNGRLTRQRHGLQLEALEPREMLDGDPIWQQFPRDSVDRLIAGDRDLNVLDPMANDLPDLELVTSGPLLPGGPSNVGDFGPGVHGVASAAFPLDLLQTEFMVFDDLAFDDLNVTDKPDLLSHGMTPITRYGTWHFFTASSGLSQPDIERVRMFARRLDPRQIFVVNIEHWATTGTEEQIASSVAKLKSVIDIIREENPSVVLGIYAMVPVRDYWTPVTFGYDSARYDLWAANNQQLQELADMVDVIFPSIYTFYPDYNEDGSDRLFERDRWVAYATANMLEARQYGKPVVSYVFPLYHGGGGSDDPNAPDYRYWKNQPIGGEFWKLILETTRQYSDGVVIWGPTNTIWNETIPWWTETVAFLDRVAASHAVSEVTVAGEVVSGGMENTLTYEAATVTIHVTDVNDAPVAKNDSFFMSRGANLSFNVLNDNGNGADTDVDGSLIPASVSITFGPQNGTLTPGGNGTFLYQPNAGFFGTDLIRYRVRDDDDSASNEASVTIVVNSPPQAINDAVSTPEDTARTIFVLSANGAAADSDVDGNLDSNSHQVVNAPQHGNVIKQTGGRFVYTPFADYFGTDQFTYTVRDSLGEVSNIATVTITIQPVNDRPRSRPDQISGLEDTELIIDVLADNGNGADSDVDGTLVPNSTTVVTPPQFGTLTKLNDGTFRYLPNRDYHGSDLFTYRVQDNQGAWSVDTSVTMQVANVNDAPHALDDFVVTPRNVPIEIDVWNANGKMADYDIDDGLTSLTIASDARQPFGTVELMDGGRIRFTPAPRFQGLDSFVYHVTDATGASSELATVSILVTDPPVARDDLIALREDESVAIRVTANNGNGPDYDVDGSLRLSAINVLTPPQHGVLVNHRNGVITYTPDPEYSGTDSFTYIIADNYLAFSNPATVTLQIATVNDRPVARDDEFLTAMNFPIEFDVLADNGHGPDSDEEDTLTTSSVRVTNTPAQGSLEQQPDGTWIYRPPLDFVGIATFSYVVADSEGLESAPATVTIEVSDFNLLPIALPDHVATAEDTAVVIRPWEDLGQGQDYDRDGTLDFLSVQISVPPGFGSAMVQSDGSVLYTPNANFAGLDSFEYTIADNEGGVSNPAIVSVQVNAVNDPPVAMDDELLGTEDTPLVFDVRADHGAGPDLDVDSDINQTQIIITQPPTSGTLEPLQGGQLRYVPNLNFFGVDTFRYRLRDDQLSEGNEAVVRITLQPVNDPPVAVDDSATVDEDTERILALIHGTSGPDIDVDSVINLASILITAPPQHGEVTVLANGTVRYSPATNYFGMDTFQYTIADQQGLRSQPATVTLEVLSVNDPPIAWDDVVVTPQSSAITIHVLQPNGTNGQADQDVDDPLTADFIELVTSPAHGSLTTDTNGNFVYAPTVGFHGSDQFAYRLVDPHNGVSETALVTIVVNNPPLARNDSIVTVEDTPVPFDLFANFGSGPDMDTDGILLADSIQILDPPADGQLVRVSGSTYRYTPDPDFFGSDSFTYRVADDDGSFSNVATVQLEVTPVNDPPRPQPDFVRAVEDLPLTIRLLDDNGSGADFDVDGIINPNSIAITVQPQYGMLGVPVNGQLTYTPNPNFHGTDQFQYTVRDDQGLVSDAVTVTIETLDAVMPPQTQNDVIVTPEDTWITFNVLNNNQFGSDFDGDGSLVPSTATNLSFPLSGGLDQLGNGSFRFRPAPNFHGSVRFEYTVRDNQGGLSGNYQVLREGPVESGTGNHLEHRWAIPVKGTAPYRVVVNGYQTSDEETFRIDYSVDGVHWTPTTILLTNASQYHSFVIPENLPSSITLRVVDTLRDASDFMRDYVFIDELYLAHTVPMDTSLASVSINDITVDESNLQGYAEFTISRTGDLTKQVTLAIETLGGSAESGIDFEPIPLRTITIPANAASRTVRVPLINDLLTEPDETFLLQITSALYANIVKAEGVATISASDLPNSPFAPTESPTESPTSATPTVTPFPAVVAPGETSPESLALEGSEPDRVDEVFSQWDPRDEANDPWSDHEVNDRQLGLIHLVRQRAGRRGLAV
jgi:hypothetical protein